MTKQVFLYLIPAWLSLGGCDQVALEDISSMDIKYQYLNLKSSPQRKKSMDDQLKLAQVNLYVLKELTKAETDMLVSDELIRVNTTVPSTIS